MNEERPKMDDTENRDTDQLKKDVAATRARLAGEVDALGDKFSADHMKDVAKEGAVAAGEAIQDAAVRMKDQVVHAAQDASVQVRQGVSRAAHETARVTRENPLPAIAMGAGLGFLAWRLMGLRAERKRSTDYDRYDSAQFGSARYGSARYEGYPSQDLPEHYRVAGDHDAGSPMGQSARRGGRDFGSEASHLADEAGSKARHLAHDARSKASDLAQDARSKASELAHDARSKASHMAEDAREWGEEAADRARNGYLESPLVYGGIAVLVGAGLAAAVPSTSQERAWVEGPKRKLAQEARSLRDAAEEHLSEAASETLGDATERLESSSSRA